MFRMIDVPGPDRRVGARETIPRWSDGSRLALGAWTFSMPLAAATLASMNLWLSTEVPPALLAITVGFFVLHAIITLFYVAFAGQNPRIERTRTAWMVALIAAGPVAIPVYWFIHVWRAPHAGRNRHVDDGLPQVESLEASRRHPTARIPHHA
jgi:hypothetical protein